RQKRRVPGFRDGEHPYVERMGMGDAVHVFALLVDCRMGEDLPEGRTIFPRNNFSVEGIYHHYVVEGGHAGGNRPRDEKSVASGYTDADMALRPCNVFHIEDPVRGDQFLFQLINRTVIGLFHRYLPSVGAYCALVSPSPQ